MLRWFTGPQTVTHPSTSPTVHSRELNSQVVSSLVMVEKFVTLWRACVHLVYRYDIGIDSFAVGYICLTVS